MNLNILKKLANKFYLYSLGLVTAICGIFGLLYLFRNILGLNSLTSIFIAYLIIVFCRAFYDQIQIYELKLEQIKFENNLVLAFLGACILTLIYYFFRVPLGDWAVPVTVIVSMKIIGQLRKILWPTTANSMSEFFKIYNQKVSLYLWGLYGFFIGIAVTVSQAVKLFGNAYTAHAFVAAIFVCLLVEQIYDSIVVYETKLQIKMFILFSLNALFFAITTTALIWILIQHLGFIGKAATITGMVCLKLIQPLITNKIVIK